MIFNKQMPALLFFLLMGYFQLNGRNRVSLAKSKISISRYLLERISEAIDKCLPN